MKPMHLASLFGTLLLSATSSLADAPAATVTQTSGPVTLVTSLAAPGVSATLGTSLHNGEYIKTAKSSLAELVLRNKTVTRLGPDTVIGYSSASREATVEKGTVLFSKPKDGEEMTFRIAEVTAAVTGTTGFVERTGDSVYLGVIEGTVHITVGAAKAVLHAGNMLVATGKTGQVVSFDVPHFISTSALFHSFNSALPNEKAVEHEVASYQNNVDRGFIAPVTLKPSTPVDHSEAVGAIGSGHEMAGSAMGTSLAGRFSTLSSHNVSLASTSLGGAFSSGITISGGTLLIGNGASGSTSGLTVNGGSISGVSGSGLSIGASNGSIINVGSGYSGTINVNGNTLNIGGSTYQVSGPGTVTVVNGGVTSINAAGGLTVNGGVISGLTGTGIGAGGLSGGAGTITLTGSGPASGGLTVSGGTVSSGTLTTTTPTVIPAPSH